MTLFYGNQIHYLLSWSFHTSSLGGIIKFIEMALYSYFKGHKNVDLKGISLVTNIVQMYKTCDNALYGLILVTNQLTINSV